MRDIHRNPILYYLLIPVLVGLWPLLVWQVYLPAAQRDREADCRLWEQGRRNIDSILTIAPDLTNPPDSNQVAGEFAYAKAIDREANLCGILPSNHNVSAGNIIMMGGKKRQDARVKLKDVSIVQAAKFLSSMQSNWVNLTCDKIELSKKKGMADQWEVDLNFIYYY